MRQEETFEPPPTLPSGPEGVKVEGVFRGFQLFDNFDAFREGVTQRRLGKPESPEDRFAVSMRLSRLYGTTELDYSRLFIPVAAIVGHPLVNRHANITETLKWGEV